jgi:hypothetical protein
MAAKKGTFRALVPLIQRAQDVYQHCGVLAARGAHRHHLAPTEQLAPRDRVVHLVFQSREETFLAQLRGTRVCSDDFSTRAAWLSASGSRPAARSTQLHVVGAVAPARMSSAASARRY